MLPSSQEESSPRRGKRQGGMVYLTNEMLSTKEQRSARIIACKLDIENKFGGRVILKLAFQGQTIFWGVNIKRNPNYQLLEEKFGRDENDWAGQDILLDLEQDDFTSNYFPRVHFPDRGAPSSKKR